MATKRKPNSTFAGIYPGRGNPCPVCGCTLFVQKVDPRHARCGVCNSPLYVVPAGVEMRPQKPLFEVDQLAIPWGVAR